MSQQSSNSSDKFEIHYRQQLSALIDGELPADEARFLLRRLQHDDELGGCQERWQLCADVLRGRATAPAPADFAARVRGAVAAEPAPQAPPAPGRRRAWGWGSGAIAASVAVLALFVTRERLPEQAPAAAPMPVIATTAQVPRAPLPADPDGDNAIGSAAAAAPAAVLAASRRDAASRSVASATRVRQAARASAARRDIPPQVQVASVAAPQRETAVAAAPAANPFAHPDTLQARPWPRSALAGSDSALNASFGNVQPQTTFYPFEPAQAQPAEEASLPPLPRH